jgi:hypothetical protein
MIGQCQRYAVAQRCLGNSLAGIQENAAVAAIAHLGRIHFAKSLDQVGLAVEIDRIAAGLGFYLVDPDRAAAFGFRREIARLSPFQGFFQGADAVGHFCGVKNQPAQGA